MSDPLSWATVGSVVLSKAVEFLFGQASDLIGRWRDRKTADVPPKDPPVGSEAILQGTLQPLAVDVEQLGKHIDLIRAQRRVLQPYLDPVDPLPISTGDDNLLASVALLRGILEQVYGQRITFQGERRDPSGPSIVSRLDVTEAAGEVTNVRVDALNEGTISAETRAGTVPMGGSLTGTDIGMVGRGTDDDS
jgi:hypothetical protein